MDANALLIDSLHNHAAHSNPNMVRFITSSADIFSAYSDSRPHLLITALRAKGNGYPYLLDYIISNQPSTKWPKGRSDSALMYAVRMDYSRLYHLIEAGVNPVLENYRNGPVDIAFRKGKVASMLSAFYLVSEIQKTEPAKFSVEAATDGLNEILESINSGREWDESADLPIVQVVINRSIGVGINPAEIDLRYLNLNYPSVFSSLIDQIENNQDLLDMMKGSNLQLFSKNIGLDQDVDAKVLSLIGSDLTIRQLINMLENCHANDRKSEALSTEKSVKKLSSLIINNKEELSDIVLSDLLVATVDKVGRCPTLQVYSDLCDLFAQKALGIEFLEKIKPIPLSKSVISDVDNATLRLYFETLANNKIELPCSTLLKVIQDGRYSYVSELIELDLVELDINSLIAIGELDIDMFTKKCSGTDDEGVEMSTLVLLSLLEYSFEKDIDMSVSKKCIELGADIDVIRERISLACNTSYGRQLSTLVNGQFDAQKTFERIVNNEFLMEHLLEGELEALILEGVDLNKPVNGVLPTTRAAYHDETLALLLSKGAKMDLCIAFEVVASKTHEYSSSRELIRAILSPLEDLDLSSEEKCAVRAMVLTVSTANTQHLLSRLLKSDFVVDAVKTLDISQLIEMTTSGVFSLKRPLERLLPHVDINHSSSELPILGKTIIIDALRVKGMGQTFNDSTLQVFTRFCEDRGVDIDYQIRDKSGNSLAHLLVLLNPTGFAPDLKFLLSKGATLNDKNDAGLSVADQLGIAIKLGAPSGSDGLSQVDRSYAESIVIENELSLLELNNNEVMAL